MSTVYGYITNDTSITGYVYCPSVYGITAEFVINRVPYSTIVDYIDGSLAFRDASIQWLIDNNYLMEASIGTGLYWNSGRLDVSVEGKNYDSSLADIYNEFENIETSLGLFVAKAGDTMTGDLTINSSLAVLGTINASYGITGRTYNTTGGLTYVINLDQYTMGVSSITGTLRIALPGGVAVPYCHISFRLIIVPQGGSPQNINISGLWLNGAWYSCAAYSTSAEVRNLKIRFARDASTRYILIGESATVWTRTMYKVENALIGYFDYPYNTYKGPYTISIDTTDASGLTVDRTVKNSDLFAANLRSLSLVADLSANDWTTIATIDGDSGTKGLSGRGTIMLSRLDQAKMVLSFSKSYTNVDLTLDSLTQHSNNVIQGIRITSDYKIQLKAGTSYVTGHVIKLLNSDGYVTLVKQASSGAEAVLKQIDLTTAVNGPIFTNNIKTQGSLEVGSIAGKLGIGTRTPNDMLDVSGNVIIGNKATALKPYLGFGTYWNGSILRSDLQGNTFGHYILSERATTAAASKLSFGITSSAGATDLFNVTGDGKFSFYGAPNLGIITSKVAVGANSPIPTFPRLSITNLACAPILKLFVVAKYNFEP